MNYETIIGLEIHVELRTKTKAYCGCENSFGGEVNSRTCPVCAGLPGALPVLNEQVVEYATRAGLAMGCQINRYSKQDRKNYFYPDTAKAYQISQYDIPICEGGSLEYIADKEGNVKTVTFERIQMEEDAGKMLHNESFEGTLIDYNRCSVPLIEIVTNPDLRSSSDARAFLETLRNTLIAIGVTDGKMQEGSIRCDVNVSVRPEGSSEFGTRVEMKNVNTFSGAARAIEYESARQIQVLQSGGTIEQETRRWDDALGENQVLRTKEDADDYRYFPEPDLLTIYVTDEILAAAGKDIPRLPHYETLYFVNEYNLPLDDANLLIGQPEKKEFFLAAAAFNRVEKTGIANWILGDITRSLNDHKVTLEEVKLTPEELVIMIEQIEQGKISTAAGKTIIEEILLTDKTPMEVIKEKNLAQISDSSALEDLARQILEEHPNTVAEYQSGRTNVLGFLVGQAMKASKGQGNPAALKEIFLNLIEQA